MQRQLGEKKPRRERETSFQKFLHLRAGLASTQPKPGESEGRREPAELAPPRWLGLLKSRPRESCGSDDFPYLFVNARAYSKAGRTGTGGPKQGDGGGPRSPDISRPDTKDLLKKMRKVDPNQSKRYRQRTGQ